MISTQNTNMKERIWIERVASEIAFQSFYPAIGVSLHNEHANAVLEEPTLHFESFQRDVADGMLMVETVSDSVSGSQFSCRS